MNLLRTTLLVVVALLGSYLTMAQSTVLNTGLTQNLNAVAIAPNGVVYAGGLTGALTKSTNEGATWQTLNLGVSNTDTVMGLKVLGGFGVDTLLVLTRRKIYKSLDGGATFTFTTNMFRSAMRAFAPINSNNIWVASLAEPCGLFHTFNGGLNWDSVVVARGSNASFLGITFPTPLVGYASGGNFVGNRFGATYRTKNGGFTWDSLPSVPFVLPAFGQQWAAYFYDAAHGFSVGAKNLLSVTADSGNTWTLLTQSDNSQPYLRCVGGSIDTMLTFGDAGYGRNGYFSKNSGSTLQDLPSNWVNSSPRPITGSQNRIMAVDYRNRIGYAVAGNGIVLKMTAASMGFIVSSPKPINLAASSIYPMPVVNGQPFRVIGLADINEQLEASLVNTTGQSIKAAHSLDGNTLVVTPHQQTVAGTYWLTIKTNGNVYRKLVVVN